MKQYFEGVYYKQQSAGKTLALIPGISNEGAFIQVITESGSYNIAYARDEYKRDTQIRVGENIFSDKGVQLNINEPDIRLTGKLVYSALTPIKGDIMGPFRFFPMECRHAVISMHHKVNGCITLNGESIDFNNAPGYIESDRGRSFPRTYAWIHSNDFERDCSIMASAAHIPFAGMFFWGCICVIRLEGREYRLATYNGAKINQHEKGSLILTKGKYRLETRVDVQPGHTLFAPRSGLMKRKIIENASCPAYFMFSKNGTVLFEAWSDHTSYEYSDL